MLVYHRVVGAINKIVLRRLVHGDAKLAGDIVLELIVIAVQVVFGDIGKDGDFRPKSGDVVQLKAADLHHIPLLRIFRHLPGERDADIADQGAVETAMAAERGERFGLRNPERVCVRST